MQVKSPKLSRSIWIGFMFLVGCLSEPEDFRGMQDKIILEYLAQNGIEAQKNPNWSYYYEVLVENEAGRRLSPGEYVGIFYKIKVMGSDQILEERSSETESALIIRHDLNAFIPKGMDLGLRNMREGERYRFFFPSYLGYRDFSYEEELEPNTILEVEIEVERKYSVFEVRESEFQAMDAWITQNGPGGVEPITTLSGLRVIITANGTGAEVKDGNQITIKHVASLLSGEVFEENTEGISIKVGAGQVVKGVEEGLKYLKRGGGKAIFVIPSHLAYTHYPLVLPDRYNQNPITCMDVVVFEVEIP
jgi:FKBP-type peptidyl-prolyl cis-trans isomerase